MVRTTRAALWVTQYDVGSTFGVGEHQGLMYYTMGQRQGLHIGGIHGRPELPWYVVAKDLNDNALIVAQGELELLFSDDLAATDASWIGEVPDALTDSLRC